MAADITVLKTSAHGISATLNRIEDMISRGPGSAADPPPPPAAATAKRGRGPSPAPSSASSNPFAIGGGLAPGDLDGPDSADEREERAALARAEAELALRNERNRIRGTDAAPTPE